MVSAILRHNQYPHHDPTIPNPNPNPNPNLQALSARVVTPDVNPCYPTISGRMTPGTVTLKRARRKGIFTAPVTLSSQSGGKTPNPWTPPRSHSMMGLEPPSARRNAEVAPSTAPPPCPSLETLPIKRMI